MKRQPDKSQTEMSASYPAFYFKGKFVPIK